MMTEKLTTIARPYALAAFEYALDKQDLSGWEAMLLNAASIVQDKNMAALMHHQNVTQFQLIEVVEDILKETMDDEGKNFLHLLAEYGRLEALPEISVLFAKHRSDYEKTMTVQVTSAIELNDMHQQKLIDALSRRLKRKVTLDCKVDETLIGGAVVRAGDMVIDGSIRGKLNRLIESL